MKLPASCLRAVRTRHTGVYSQRRRVSDSDRRRVLSGWRVDGVIERASELQKETADDDTTTVGWRTDVAAVDGTGDFLFHGPTDRALWHVFVCCRPFCKAFLIV